MFTKAKIVAWNGERGVAYDALDTAIHFTRAQVHPSDVIAIDVGVDVLYNQYGTVELASSSFLRWMEANTLDVEGNLWVK